jgi:excisionase family DNA binding protein
MADEWHTVAQIAAQLQVHERTVRRWLRAGTLPGRNFGGKAGWRVRATDVERFMAEWPQPPTTRPPGGTDG